MTQPARLVIGYDNYGRASRGGTWTVDPAPVLTMGTRYLGDPRRAYPCRVPGTTMTLTLALPAALPVGMLGSSAISRRML